MYFHVEELHQKDKVNVRIRSKSRSVWNACKRFYMTQDSSELTPQSDKKSPPSMLPQCCSHWSPHYAWIAGSLNFLQKKYKTFIQEPSNPSSRIYHRSRTLRYMETHLFSLINLEDWLTKTSHRKGSNEASLQCFTELNIMCSQNHAGPVLQVVWTWWI